MECLLWNGSFQVFVTVIENCTSKSTKLFEHFDEFVFSETSSLLVFPHVALRCQISRYTHEFMHSSFKLHRESQTFHICIHLLQRF